LEGARKQRIQQALEIQRKKALAQEAACKRLLLEEQIKKGRSEKLKKREQRTGFWTCWLDIWIWYAGLFFVLALGWERLFKDVLRNLSISPTLLVYGFGIVPILLAPYLKRV